eukprot:scaffold31989_cov54-Attheya_sp.AAC.6
MDDDTRSVRSGITMASSFSEQVAPTQPAWDVTPTSVAQSSASNPDPSRKSFYAFDQVFGPKSTTRSLYKESISDVVTSAMEGYHASVFAYGQTSTGKTYTMSGTRQDPGVVPLAVRDCFRYIRHNASKDREFLFRVSYMEIYNEQIFDLLTSPSGGSQKSLNASGNNLGAPLAPTTIRIFESKNEGVIVRGLREEVVTSPEQVFSLIAAGEARRRTGSTGMNKQSSRSHSIFRFLIESRARHKAKSNNGDDDEDMLNSDDDEASNMGGPVRVSSLSLVDLAGSECAKMTGATGARQKEGKYINKSLMTLGHVIWKLSELAGKSNQPDAAERTHIPYRDSKLTRLLQPSLSGNAQICIICNISPHVQHLDESHNTLKFATRAKRIKQFAKITEVVDDKTLLQNYREEIEALKRQLRDSQEVQQKVGTAPMSPKSADKEIDEETKVLVMAIQNLEKLILRKNNGAEGLPRRDSMVSMDGDLLSPDDDLESLTGDAMSSMNGGINGELGDSELVSELHRIQGLLGAVLKRKGVGRPTEEVEELKHQLHEQEVATSLRQADSSFLQSQLAEKDNLLKEVSKILDAVEKRQVELETENSKMRDRLARTLATLSSRESELISLKARMAKANVNNIKDDDDDDMFGSLVEA